MSHLQLLTIFMCILVLPKQIHSCHPQKSTTSPGDTTTTGTSAGTTTTTATPPPGGSCNTCTAGQLALIPIDEAISRAGAPPAPESISTSVPTDQPVADQATGCLTLTPSCPNQILVVRVFLANDPNALNNPAPMGRDWGVEDPGTNTLTCQNGRWVHSATATSGPAPKAPGSGVPRLCRPLASGGGNNAGIENCIVEAWGCVRTATGDRAGK